MDSYYDQSYTYEQIESILSKIKRCIKEHRYTISMNEHRGENIAFLQSYQLTSKKQRDILRSLTLQDFAYTLKNTKAGYEHEVLYVFAPYIHVVDCEGHEKVIPVYLKFNLIEALESAKKMFLVVISIHECKKQIQYQFK